MADGKIRVLLIEDEVELVEMYQMKFQEEGYEVLVANNGLDGLEIAKKENPDCILLDIMLPTMDGFAVLKEIKESAKTKKIPVILLSNLGQDIDKEKGKALGAVDYLVKADFTPAQVADKVGLLLRHKS